MTTQKDMFIATTTILVAAILLVGCATSANVGKCILPCWEGITPGVTSAEEAERILQKKYQITDSEEFPKYTSIDWKGEDREGIITFSKGITTGMNITYSPEEQLTLGDIVAMLGEPEWVDVTIGPGDNDMCGLALYFPSQGTVVDSYRPDDSGVIEASQHVRGLLLFVGREGASSGFDPEARKVNWSGFGTDYCVLAEN